MYLFYLSLSLCLSLSLSLSLFLWMQVYSFFAINRIQTVAFGSMRRLNMPVPLIATYIDEAMRNYGLSDASIDISKRPHLSVIMGLLDKGIEHSVHPNRNESKLLKSLSTQDSLDGRKGDHPFGESEDHTNSLHARCKHTTLGFNALLEAVFYLAALADPASPISKLLQKMKTERAAEGAVLDQMKIAKYELKCVCGMPLNTWKPLGLFDSLDQGAENSQREFMNYFLCELCFRQCVSSLGQLGAVINGGIGQCVVPITKGETAQSFLCLFYGNAAARNGFQNNSGQHVRLHALGNFSTLNVKFKKRGKVKQVNKVSFEIVYQSRRKWKSHNILKNKYNIIFVFLLFSVIVVMYS